MSKYLASLVKPTEPASQAFKFSQDAVVTHIKNSYAAGTNAFAQVYNSIWANQQKISAGTILAAYGINAGEVVNWLVNIRLLLLQINPDLNIPEVPSHVVNTDGTVTVPVVPVPPATPPPTPVPAGS